MGTPAATASLETSVAIDALVWPREIGADEEDQQCLAEATAAEVRRAVTDCCPEIRGRDSSRIAGSTQ